MNLYAAACGLSRWDADLVAGTRTNDAVARLFVVDALNEVERALDELGKNSDSETLAAARGFVASGSRS